LGAKIFRNSVKEIGWFPVQGVSSIDSTTFSFPPSTEVFHWHGETFALPTEATLLAKSEGCKNQAFQFGRSVIGLQFHIETTPESALELVNHCREELLPSKFIQSEASILDVPPKKYQIINDLMDEVLIYLNEATG
jgi:GMP synthase-like glutamine amidotransferase